MAVKKGLWTDNNTGDILYPQTSSDMVIQDSEHRFVTDKEKSNWNNLQRDNLLINSDFRFGVINQRGQSTYGATNSWKYSIDRWLYFGQMSVVVNSGSVTFQANSSNSGYSYVKQILPYTQNGTFTLNIRIKELNGNVKIDGINKTLQTGDNIVTFATNLNKIQFNLYGASVKMTVEFIKIEEGKAFTGMPVWNYEIELAKCKRFCQTIGIQNGYTYYFGTTTARMSRVVMYIPLSTKLAKKPTVTGNFAIKFRFFTDLELWVEPTGYEVEISSDSQIALILHLDGLNRNVSGECYVDGIMVFDAEIY